jgi:predicted transcriptional regulator
MTSPIKIPKITQQDIARTLGISQSYVSRVIKGKVNNPKRREEIVAIIKNQTKAA